MKKQITTRQKQLLLIIYNYIKSTGYPPTFEEMRENLDVSSNQSVIDLLKKLEEREIIKKGGSAARSITILPAGYEVLDQPSLVPFLGVSAAGAPIETIEIHGEWQSIGEVAKLKDEVFLVRVSGDSMINAGIDDGDMALVKSEKEFYSGDIVLVQKGDSSTIKRFISDDNPPFVYLKPENPAYPVIPFNEDMRMTGKVISILKQGQWKPLK